MIDNWGLNTGQSYLQIQREGNEKNKNRERVEKSDII